MTPLFEISTERFRMTWSGLAGPSEIGAPTAVLRVHARRADAAPRLRIDGKSTGLECVLALAEQTSYHVFARSCDGAPIVLRNSDPVATRALRATEDGSILAGTVNFGGQIGRSRFVVAVGGVDELAFDLDIRPVKITLAEVESMRSEIEETVAGLAFEYLRSTKTPVAVANAGPARATWLSMVRRVLPSLEQAMQHIAVRPRCELVRDVEVTRSERIRRTDATVRRAVLRSHRSGVPAGHSRGLVVQDRLPHLHAQTSLDTPEHRWLRNRLGHVREKLSAMRRAERVLPLSARRFRTCEDLQDAEQRVARLLRLEPLENARATASLPLPTQRLMTVSGYGEAYDACRTLTFALDLSDGSLSHATRDLHLLYEIWCYLTVARRVACALGQPVPEHALFRTTHHGIRLMLRKGHRHHLHFEDGDRLVHLTYNPSFGARVGLLTQRPDIVLTVVSSESTQRYVLDAKYRRDDSARYRRRYGVPGPPDEALGDLHRYRDAIVESVAGEVHRTVRQALALFPYRVPADEPFAATRLWTSIQQVGVGAIPLLPGATDHLDEWLSQVLNAG